jgi:hypothetical protein
MALTQTTFLAEFRAAMEAEAGARLTWSGGQQASNTAGFTEPPARRREVGRRDGERFELGDVTTELHGHRVVVEFESDSLPVSNLLKYWPYLRGELTVTPSVPLVICHFSNWRSYATRRDLWEWAVVQIQADPRRLVPLFARQFDHWGTDASLRTRSIKEAAAWVHEVARAGTASTATIRARAATDAA